MCLVCLVLRSDAGEAVDAASAESVAGCGKCGEHDCSGEGHTDDRPNDPVADVTPAASPTRSTPRECTGRASVLPDTQQVTGLTRQYPADRGQGAEADGTGDRS